MRRFVVAVGMLVAATVSGQTQKYGESVTVTVVEVPVTVVDRGGKPVRGLTQEQFEVTVDGKKIRVTGFDTVDLAVLADEPPSSRPLPPVAYRNFLLLFDLAHSSPGTIGRAQAAARELVTTGLTTRDVAAVATHSIENGLNVVTSFTSDRALLLEAIDTLGVPEYFKPPDPLRIARITSSVQPNPDAQGAMKAVGAGAADAIAREWNRFAELTEDEDQRARVKKQLRQFGTVARMLDGLAGQKQVVLLSEGFDADIIEGRSDTTKEDKEKLERGEIWNVTSEQHFGSSRSAAEIGEMAELFRRSDVKLHAIDIKGLRSDVDAKAGVKRTANDALYFLTRPTGGTVFDHDTNLGESFSRLLAEQEVIYVLAFESPLTLEPNRFHELKVKVRAPGNPRVSHRAGFYERSSSPASPLQDRLALADVLMKEGDVTDVALSLFAVALPLDDGQAPVPIVLELPGEKLLAEARGGTLTAEFFVYAFDEQKQVRDFLQQRLGLEVARHGERLSRGGLRYVTSLRLPPGTHVIKALVRVDETGRYGLTRATVTVPASGSAVFVGEPSSWINVAAPGRGDDAVAAFSVEETKFSPVSNPLLARGASVRLAVFADDRQNRDVHAEWIGPDGSAGEVSLPVVSSDAEKVLVTFSPPGMAAGDYRLRIVAGTVRVELPFRLQ